MGKEIELKLIAANMVEPEYVLSHPLVKPYSRKPATRRLFSIYFDTPDCLLYRHRMALRVRHEGNRFVQTLKTRGQSFGGLSHRGEWEWPLPNDQLDLFLVPKDHWPVDVSQSLNALSPVFQTVFDRFSCQVFLPADFFGPGQPPASVELAFDRGEISAGQMASRLHDPISEIEMELKSGDPVTLFDFALAVCDGIAVFPSDISKAERGYRLINPTLFSTPRCSQVVNRESIAAEAFTPALNFEITQWSWMRERFYRSREPVFLIGMKAAIRNIHWLITLFKLRLPSSEATYWMDRLSDSEKEIGKVASVITKENDELAFPDKVVTPMILGLSKWLLSLRVKTDRS